LTTGTRDGAQKWTVVLLILAYFFLAAIIVALYVAFGKISREQAARAAEQRSAAVAQRADCYRRLEANPDLLALLDTMADDRRDRIQANLDSIAAEPDSALNDIRRRSIQKSRRAIEGIERFVDQIERATPTLEECDALSVRLGLQPKPEPST
jgi:hypothetical protein